MQHRYFIFALLFIASASYAMEDEVVKPCSQEECAQFLREFEKRGCDAKCRSEQVERLAANFDQKRDAQFLRALLCANAKEAVILNAESGELMTTKYYEKASPLNMSLIFEKTYNLKLFQTVLNVYGIPGPTKIGSTNDDWYVDGRDVNCLRLVDDQGLAIKLTEEIDELLDNDAVRKTEIPSAVMKNVSDCRADARIGKNYRNGCAYFRRIFRFELDQILLSGAMQEHKMIVVDRETESIREQKMADREQVLREVVAHKH